MRVSIPRAAFVAALAVLAALPCAAQSTTRGTDVWARDLENMDAGATEPFALVVANPGMVDALRS